jgi:hypothetical protein
MVRRWGWGVAGITAEAGGVTRGGANDSVGAGLAGEEETTVGGTAVGTEERVVGARAVVGETGILAASAVAEGGAAGVARAGGGTVDRFEQLASNRTNSAIMMTALRGENCCMADKHLGEAGQGL